LVALFRNRRQLGGDQSPGVAVVFTAKNLAAGGAAENRANAAGFFQAERAELVFQARRQSAAQLLPVSAAVAAPIDFSLGARRRPGFAPGDGVVLGGGDEHEIGIFRIPGKAVGINVDGPIRACPALPTAAAAARDV